MLHRYFLKRDLTFLSILAIGISYVSLLLLTFSKVMNGCLMQMILLAERLSDPVGNIWELVTSSQFLTHTIFGFFNMILIIWVGRGLVKAGNQIFKTNKLLSNLDVIKNIPDRNIIVFRSSLVQIFTAGFLNPKVYVSSRIWHSFTRKQIQTMFLHEKSHMRNLDPLKSVIVNIVKFITPPFILKNEFFESYSLLTELACDEYSESQLNDKKPIIESLLALLRTDEEQENFGVNGFISQKDRISILVGKAQFGTVRLLLQIIIFWGVLIASLSWASKTNAFSSCNHLDECFTALFTSSTEELSGSTAICGEHASEHLMMSTDKATYERFFQTSIKSL